MDYGKVLVAKNSRWSEDTLIDGWGEVGGHEGELGDLVVKIFHKKCEYALPMGILWTPQTGEVWAEQHDQLAGDMFIDLLECIWGEATDSVWNAVIGEPSDAESEVAEILKEW